MRQLMYKASDRRKGGKEKKRKEKKRKEKKIHLYNR